MCQRPRPALVVLLVMALVLLLAACDTLPRRVEVPVPVSCIAKADTPKRPELVTDQTLRHASRGERVLAMRNYQDLAEPYIGQLEAIVGRCAGN